jgi:hypothetical protein
MSEDEKQRRRERMERNRGDNRGTASRMRDHNAVLRATRNPRAAIRAYASGNRWLEENARAVGNW